MDTLALFEWLDASVLAQVSKSSGGVFALIQTIHLASLALLGGMVIATDLRLMNILMKDIPIKLVVAGTQRWINYALVTISLSGIYQMSAVAIKLYHNSFFWSKMAAFSLSLLFLYLIKLPVLRQPNLSPWLLKILAAASLTTWFTVAASGRWIGFS